MVSRSSRPFVIAFCVAVSLAQGADAAAISAASLLGATPRAKIEKTQFVFGGDPFCWFEDGWNGPGWYRCSYGPWMKGYWWGGAYGWNGWRGGHPGPRAQAGGPNQQPRAQFQPQPQPRIQAQSRPQQPHPHPARP